MFGDTSIREQVRERGRNVTGERKANALALLSTTTGRETGISGSSSSVDFRTDGHSTQRRDASIRTMHAKKELVQQRESADTKTHRPHDRHHRRPLGLLETQARRSRHRHPRSCNKREMKRASAKVSSSCKKQRRSIVLLGSGVVIREERSNRSRRLGLLHVLFFIPALICVDFRASFKRLKTSVDGTEAVVTIRLSKSVSRKKQVCKAYSRAPSPS